MAGVFPSRTEVTFAYSKTVGAFTPGAGDVHDARVLE